MIKITIMLLILSIFLTTSYARAKPTIAPVEETKFSWNDRNGNPIPDSDSRKSKDNFAAQLILTGDTKLWETWAKLPAEEAPRITTIKNPAPRNKPIFFALIYANPKKDPTDFVNVEASFEITKPDGKISKPPTTVGARGKLPGPANNLRLGVPAMAYVVENSDPSGTYKIVARVKDKIRNVEIILQNSFSVK